MIWLCCTKGRGRNRAVTLLQIVDAGVAASADTFCRDLDEDALDEVHPRRAGGREMQLETPIPR